MAHDVFVSYSVKDKSFADGLCATLENKKIRCWVAPRDVLPGQNYAEALIEAINTSRVMVLIFSSNSNNSPHVSREVERAVNKSIPIIPVRIENVVPTKAMEYFLSSPHWLDALTPPIEKHLEKLAETILALLGKPNQSAGMPSASTTKCPECGKPMSSNLEYCLNCGKKLPKTSTASSADTRDSTGAVQNCPGCGKSMPVELEYCSNCGKTLPKMPTASEAGNVATQRCPGCGETMPVGLEYCTNCGKKLVKTSTSATDNASSTGVGQVNCSGCGKSMPVGLEYCSNCGKKLVGTAQANTHTPKATSLQEDKVTCTGCGQPMPNTLEYCTNCGKKLAKTPMPAKPNQSD
jgi:predicted amidophosphoribosyltransferase